MWDWFFQHKSQEVFLSEGSVTFALRIYIYIIFYIYIIYIYLILFLF